MSLRLIKPGQVPSEGEAPSQGRYLEVSELFRETIQGEGRWIGHPATFLRLAGCNVNCSFCDSKLIWKKSQKYSFREIFSLLEEGGAIEAFKGGEHLVITGGNPLLQMSSLEVFLKDFHSRYGFLPFIELETEGTIVPSALMMTLVDTINCSPKLSNSGVDKEIRMNLYAISKISSHKDSYFKFVIGKEEDWEEVEETFMKFIKHPSRVYLMPEAATREELEKKREMVINLAIKKGVNFTDRLQVTVWDTKTGV